MALVPFLAGKTTARPHPGYKNRIWFDVDLGTFARDTGTSWAPYTIGVGEVDPSLINLVDLGEHSYESLTNVPVEDAQRSFVAAGAGTYTATIVLPADSVLDDMLITNQVLWDNATSATLNISDGVTTLVTNLNLKTTPAANAQGITLDLHSGGFHTGGVYYASQTTLTITVVTVGAGSAGRTRVFASWHQPDTAVVAVKS